MNIAKPVLPDTPPTGVEQVLAGLMSRVGILRKIAHSWNWFGYLNQIESDEQRQRDQSP